MRVVYEFKKKEFVEIVDSMLHPPAKGKHEPEVYEAVRQKMLELAGSAQRLHQRVVQVYAPDDEQPGCCCPGRCCKCGEGCE